MPCASGPGNQGDTFCPPGDFLGNLTWDPALALLAKCLVKYI